jgi:N-acetylneuraminic acid mutarotase
VGAGLPILLGPSLSAAATVGTWSTTGALPLAVSGASATLLGNGKVLVAGGRTGGPASTTFTSAAEIYDPTSGAWSTTGAMPVAVANASASLLSNGDVLVAGGTTSVSGTVESTGLAELYSPSTGLWTATQALPSAIAVSGAASALLANGDVLVAGGATSSGSTVSEAALYNPTSGTWTSTGSMPGNGAARAAAALLANGDVLVAGGVTEPSGGSASVTGASEIYDTAAGTWSTAAPLPTPVAQGTAVALSSGSVLVAGGSTTTAGTPTALSQLYSDSGGTWTATGGLPGSGSYGASATLLADGDVLYAGGLMSATTASTAVSLYALSTGTWTATAPLSVGEGFGTATLLPSGYLLVAGGATDSTTATTASELYDAGVPVAITSAATTSFAAGVAGTFSVTTTGSPTPALTESGTLPSGVTFTDNKNGTATIAGTPLGTAVGSYSFSISATNGVGPAVTQSFVLAVAFRSTKGYWYVTNTGSVQHQGAATLFPTTSKADPFNIVTMAATPDAAGYYLVGAGGNVYNYGDAKFYGSKAHAKLKSPVVAMSVTSDGAGYYLVTARGNLYNFGDAKFHGSPVHVALTSPVVAMAITPDGAGYWLATASGTVFAYGDAHTYGSVSVNVKSHPVVAIASSVDGLGYDLVTSKGNVLNEGDAKFFGSLAGRKHLPAPVVAFVTTSSGGGYYLVTAKGNIYNEGAAPFYGSSARTKLDGSVTGFAGYLPTS